MKLIDVYTDGLNGNGIFSDLQTLSVPWESESIDTELDIMYYSQYGEKTCSPLVTKRLNTSGALTNAARLSIASAINTLFGYQWSKLYDTLSTQYNPIENYRMTETETIDAHVEGGNTDTGTISRDASNSRTDTGTVTTDKDDVISNDVYGFNSDSAVSSDGSTISNDVTETHNLTFGDSVDETETRNLAATSETDTDSERTLTRYGNIGVTTSQQLLQSERDLWMWNFFQSVFDDINSVLTLPVYEYDESEV